MTRYLDCIFQITFKYIGQVLNINDKNGLKPRLGINRSHTPWVTGCARQKCSDRWTDEWADRQTDGGPKGKNQMLGDRQARQPGGWRRKQTVASVYA